VNPRLIARLCPWAALALVVRCILEYFIEDKRDFIATVASTTFMAAMLLWAGKKLKEQSKSKD
jgi:hypothetical protein